MVLIKFKNEIEPIYKMGSDEFYNKYGFYVEDIISDNKTCYNFKDFINWDFTANELNSLQIVREYQNLNSSFRSSIIPVDELKEFNNKKIHIKDFLNLRQNIYRGYSKYYDNLTFWRFSFNISMFKGMGTDLYFIRIKFKKIEDLYRFFALMGYIARSYIYKGEFTRRERKLIYKLKNPVKSNYLDLDELKFKLYWLKKDREELIKKYNTFKGMNKYINRYYNKWGTWGAIPSTTRAKFVRMNETKRELKTNRFKIKKLKALIFEVEDNLLNTNKLWSN